jgi:hypothetical protein
VSACEYNLKHRIYNIRFSVSSPSWEFIEQIEKRKNVQNLFNESNKLLRREEEESFPEKQQCNPRITNSFRANVGGCKLLARLNNPVKIVL